jgi:hypothetical protein
MEVMDIFLWLTRLYSFNKNTYEKTPQKILCHLPGTASGAYDLLFGKLCLDKKLES